MIHTTKFKVRPLAVVAISLVVFGCSDSPIEPQGKEPLARHDESSPPSEYSTVEVEALIVAIVVEDRRQPTNENYSEALQSINNLPLRQLTPYLTDSRPAIAYESVEFPDKNGNVGPSRYAIGDHINYIIISRLYWYKTIQTSYNHDVPDELNDPEYLTDWLAVANYDEKRLAADLKQLVSETRTERIKSARLHNQQILSDPKSQLTEFITLDFRFNQCGVWIYINRSHTQCKIR